LGEGDDGWSGGLQETELLKGGHAIVEADLLGDQVGGAPEAQVGEGFAFVLRAAYGWRAIHGTGHVT
jgi:hypothetical protein